MVSAVYNWARLHPLPAATSSPTRTATKQEAHTLAAPNRPSSDGTDGFGKGRVGEQKERESELSDASMEESSSK